MLPGMYTIILEHMEVNLESVLSIGGDEGLNENNKSNAKPV